MSNEAATLSDFMSIEQPNVYNVGEEGNEVQITSADELLRDINGGSAPQPDQPAQQPNNVVPLYPQPSEAELALRQQELDSRHRLLALEAAREQEEKIEAYRARVAAEAEAAAKGYFPDLNPADLPEGLRGDYEALKPIIDYAVNQARAEDRQLQRRYAQTSALTIKALEQRLEQAQQLASQAVSPANRVEQELAALVPDVGSLTRDPNFIKFRDGIDEATGMSRRSLINTAYHEGNAQAIARILNQYKGSTGASGVGASPRPNLSSGPATRNQQQPVLSASDLEAAMRKVEAGLMDYDTYAKLEERYVAAGLTGRVV